MDRNVNSFGAARRQVHAPSRATHRTASLLLCRRLWPAIGLLLALLPVAAHAAPVQYSSNGHSYEAVSKSGGLTWNEANDAANARIFNGLHGHLATMTTPGENDFIVQHLPQAISGGYWLGGMQSPGILDPAAGWQWITGEPFSFTNWNNLGPDEPDDSWGPGTTSRDENRLQFLFQAYGGWNDLQPVDREPRGYVVEYEPDPPVDLPTITGYANTQATPAPISSAPPGTPLVISGANLGTKGTVLFDGVPLTAAAEHDTAAGA